MIGRFTSRRVSMPDLPVIEEDTPAVSTILPQMPAEQTPPVQPQPAANPLLSDKLLDAKVRLHRRLIEEINPAWLLQGENSIRFRSPNGQAYIRNARLIVETDSGWNSVLSVSPSTLNDGDTATSYAITASSTNPSIEMTFERPVQPGIISLFIGCGLSPLIASMQTTPSCSALCASIGAPETSPMA